MNVTVILVGPFRIGRFNEELREYPPGSTVQTVIDDLLLPAPLLGTTLLNGAHARGDEPLRDGDTVSLLPFLDGG